MKPNQVLIDILEPIYERDNDSVRGIPIPKDVIPCGFGGATGSLDEVRLVIITAEPGNPTDGAGYHEGMQPEEMVIRSARIFYKAMDESGVRRGGMKHSKFHTNMRYILNRFWPREKSLEDQLRKTWATNTVLWPLPEGRKNHSPALVKYSAQTYLRKELDLFPNAFVLVLGKKARERMNSVGLNFHAYGNHPSDRKSNEEMMASWDAAADVFHSRGH